jgi:hypothetical protein
MLNEYQARNYPLDTILFPSPPFLPAISYSHHTPSYLKPPRKSPTVPPPIASSSREEERVPKTFRSALHRMDAKKIIPSNKKRLNEIYASPNTPKQCGDLWSSTWTTQACCSWINLGFGVSMCCAGPTAELAGQKYFLAHLT